MKLLGSMTKDKFAFVLIAFFLTIFVVVALIEKIDQPPNNIVLVSLLGLLVVGLATLLATVNHIAEITALTFKEQLVTILGSCIGALVTYFISISLHISPVISAALVGCLAAYWPKTMPEWSVAMYCGAFVGMSGNFVLGEPILILVSAFIAGITLILSRKVFVGVGGKLGTLAFMSVAITVSLVVLLRLIR